MAIKLACKKVEDGCVLASLDISCLRLELHVSNCSIIQHIPSNPLPLFFLSGLVSVERSGDRWLTYRQWNCPQAPFFLGGTISFIVERVNNYLSLI